MLAVKRGDKLAFETVVKRHQSRLFAIAFRYTRVREDAEDVVQEAFHKAFLHFNKFQERSSLSTWLTRITINEALMCLRRFRPGRDVFVEDLVRQETIRFEVADLSPNPEAAYLVQEDIKILSQAIEQLRPAIRVVVQLREFRELSTKQTAERLGLSVAAVKGRLFQGKRKLRQKMDDYQAPQTP